MINQDRTAYVCTNCRYEFTRKTNVQFSSCPYCGKRGTVDLKTENFASKILDEVSSLNL